MLHSFYQNHRRYVKSFDARQLQGDMRTIAQIQSNCDPLYQAEDPVDKIMKPIYPCGLIANSVFNDTFSPMIGKSNNYTWLTTGIAWPSDKNKYGPPQFTSADVVPPPNWSNYNGYAALVPYFYCLLIALPRSPQHVPDCAVDARHC